jgi:hypothetical protein
MNTREIIAQLKTEKRKQGLSNQQIADRCAELGSPVSISTVKRVFSSESEQYDFRYDTTLQPLISALCGPNGLQDAAQEESQVERLTMQVEALKGQIEALTRSDSEKAREIEKAHAAIAHKTRVEWILALVCCCLAVVLTVFYVSHALMGW